jgi:nitroreductase
MNFCDVIKGRYSIRKFLDKEVPDILIEKILELSKLAPSAGNLQAYKVVIVKDEEVKKRLHSIEAPVFLIICALPEVSAGRYGDRGRNLYSIQDATIFASYIQLAAVDLGLATVWIGAFSENKVREILKLSEDLRPLAMILLGYPAVEKFERRRRKLKEIIVKLPLQE